MRGVILLHSKEGLLLLAGETIFSLLNLVNLEANGDIQVGPGNWAGKPELRKDEGIVHVSAVVSAM